MIAASSAAELERARSLATRNSLPWIDLDAETIDPRAVRRLPLELLTSALAVPYRIEDGALLVALADPAARPAIERRAETPLDFVVASRASVMNALGSILQSSRNNGALMAVPPAHELGDEPEQVFIGRAADSGATDLHLVPCDTGLSVRARIDGVLREIGRITADASQPAVSRLKVQSRLDISENRRAQEGHMTVTSPSGRAFDVRLTILPTVAGEGVAVRILEKTSEPPTLTELGLSPEVQLQLERVVNDQRGALLVTGPTGSGKTTTIFAALAGIVRPELNVVTVEDPVEYRIDGIYQLEVNPTLGVTFESSLRAILRTDPDIVAVGEMRDLATASTTLKAALTGSFVLSTLHTTDAPAAITRLLDLGVEPYVTAATVTAVLAQRLVRRVCVYCRERYDATAVEREELGLDGEAQLFRARGCELCDRGYRGQIGIHQLMVLDDELRQLTLERAPHNLISEVAEAHGMRSLWADGLAKALAGLTTVEEVRRAVA
jgi:type II secretory ATPase GspE/PulE/Tfp pilus assembly ATPase PilB-like protein